MNRISTSALLLATAAVAGISLVYVLLLSSGQFLGGNFQTAQVAGSISVGSRVQVTSVPTQYGGALIVRSGAGLSYNQIATEATNNKGTVLGGPTSADGLVWWRISYDDGVTGWSIQNYLIKIAGGVDTQPPSVPTGLSVSLSGGTTANLAWTASTDNVAVTGYKVYRNGSPVGTVINTSFSDTGLSANSTYSYAVSAFDAAGNNSALSAISSVTTPSGGDTTPPVISTISISNVSPTGGTISWYTDENSDTQVEYGLTSAYGSNTTIDSTLTKSHSVVLSGLSQNTLYHLRTRSKDASGNQGVSGDITMTTLQSTTGTYTVTVTKSGTGSGRVWGGSMDCGTTCSVTLAAGTWYTLGVTPSSGSLFGGWTGDGTCTGAQQYCNMQVNSDKTIVARFASSVTENPDTTPPSVPTGLSATAVSSSQINLTWTASTDPTVQGAVASGVAGYRISRNGTQIGTSATNSYSVTGLSGGTSYSFTVAAYDGASPANVSAQSSSASATTLPNTSTKFKTGDSVQTTSSVNVRSTPSTSGTLLGTQALGATGSVTGGPTYANGYWWWSVNYSTAPSGWTVEDYLTSYNAPVYTLSVAKTGTGSGTVSCGGTTCPTSVNGGTALTLTESPASGSTFAGWSGACSGTASTCSLTVNSNTSVTANFNAVVSGGCPTGSTCNFSIGDRVSVSSSDGSARIFSGPAVSSTYGTQSNGAVATVIGGPTAVGSEIWYQFDFDSGTDGWDSQSYFVSYVTPVPHLLTVIKLGSGLALITSSPAGINCGVSCSSTFNAGTTVTITAVPVLGSNTVATWTGCTTTTGNNCTVRVGSSDVNVTVQLTVDTTPPSIPIGVTGTANSPTSATISWQPSTDNVAVAGYNVYRNNTQVGWTNTTSYNDSGLTANTNYSYTVAAYDAVGNTSVPSNPVSVTTPSAPPPGQFPPSDRAVNWSQAGVWQDVGSTINAVKGIPNYPVCQTLAAGASAATVQTAINSCPNYTAIVLPAGNYSFSGVQINKPVVLRGAGADKTFVNGGNLTITVSKYSGAAAFSNGQVPTGTAVTSWTGGFAKGTTQITLSNTSNLSVGQEIVLDEYNDTSFVNPNVEGSCANMGNNSCGRSDCITAGDPCSYGFGKSDSRALMQIVRIVAINGSNVTIDSPLYVNYSGSLNPQAFYWNGGNLRGAGIENMSVNGNNGSAVLAIKFCTDCWLKGVHVTHFSRGGVYVFWTKGTEIRDSFFDQIAASGPGNYVLEIDNNSQVLVENNIFDRDIADVEFGFPNSGSVVGYNATFHDSPTTSWLYPVMSAHDAHNHSNLYEGNVAASIYHDAIWGSGGYNTFFRNRLYGFHSAYTPGNPPAQNYAIGLEAWQRYDSIAGNILGTTHNNTYQTTINTPYSCVYEAGGQCQWPVYYLGFANTSHQTAGYDSQVLSTLIRGGNYDYATKAVVWSSNAPDTFSQYIPSQTLPASLYLAAKPAWFGSSNFPAIGPDTAGYLDDTIAKIPAERCYASVSSNTANFNSQTCYGQ